MHLKYRPEIDGLRTIAVLSVLIYHAEFAFGTGKLLSGGFLGVDIFFVISGFLITSLILKELHQTGSFSISSFYERRARRLLPALFIVMLVTLPFAWLYLIPEQFIDFSKSQISSLLFSSNFYWDHSLQKYGAESSLIKPFLHTWSLAVEEQFYIIFPLFMLAIYRWCKNHITTILSLSLLSSLIFSEWMTGQDPSSSFYMLPSRFWELLAGSLLAYKLYLNPIKQLTSARQYLPILGLALIIASLLLTEFNDNHPGFITLTVILGTLLIIWFANEKDPVTRLLSSRLFVAIGLISYSLYLWHYPIFAFGRIINSTPTAFDKFSWFALSFILAILSYRLIEKPFRNRTSINKRHLFIIAGISAVAIFFLNAFTLHFKGYPSRLPPILSSIEMKPSKIRICNEKTSCSFNKEAADTIFLVGDSHIMPLEKPLLKYIKEHNYKLTTLNANGCQYILNLNNVRRTTNKANACNIEFQNSRRDILLSTKNSVVIIGGNLPSILPSSSLGNKPDTAKRQLQYPDNSLTNTETRRTAIIKEYRNTIFELANHGHKVILIYPVPAANGDIPSKLAQLIFRKKEDEIKSILYKNQITTSFDDHLEKTKDSYALLDDIKHKNIFRIYPETLFCNTTIQNKCVSHTLSESYYRDYHHLSETGAAMLFEQIRNKIK